VAVGVGVAERLGEDALVDERGDLALDEIGIAALNRSIRRSPCSPECEVVVSASDCTILKRPHCLHLPNEPSFASTFLISASRRSVMLLSSMERSNGRL
jgi:hypothetical protein